MLPDFCPSRRSRDTNGKSPPNWRAIPPLASLRAFETVGRLGGIRKAAASLSLDHSVVSRHLKQLEDWIGIALFRRQGGKVDLSEVGVRYHGRVSAALAELALATSEIQDSDTEKSLLVWCVPGFAAQWVADRLGAFEHAMPDVSVELRPTDVRANLLAHEADADIRFYLDDWPPELGGRGIQYVELARPRIMIVASPATAEALGDQLEVDDLLDAPLLHEEHDYQWRSWLSLNNIGRPLPERIPGPLLWHAHLAIAAARSNRGLALANPFLVDADLRSGALVELKVAGTRNVEIGSYAIVAREDRWTSDAILGFRRFLQSEVARFVNAPASLEN